jgi:hypothetical protein
MNEIKLDTLSEIEELQAIMGLYEKAKAYLENFEWCLVTKRCWYDKDNGIYEKLGIFLFEIEPLNNNVDDFIWIIVGDLPSFYLDKSVTTGQEALQVYCELMEDWIDKVKKGESILECFPIPAAPTIENAELLNNRISFIRRELVIPK